MRLLAVTLAVPALLLAWQWWGDRETEQVLRPAAAGVAGRSVEVQCQTLWGALLDAQGREGEVFFDADGIPEAKLFLTHPTCKRLRAFAKRRRHAELDCLRTVDWARENALPVGSDCYRHASPTFYAVLILAHEAYHTAGVMDEAATNCYAIQGMAWTATQLGAPADEAQLMALAMAEVEPFQGTDYATSLCVPGSGLDLHPETPDFPTELPIAPPLGRGGRRGLASGATSASP